MVISYLLNFILSSKDHLISHGCLTDNKITVENNESKKQSFDFIKCPFCLDSVPITESSVCNHCLERYCLIHRHQIDHQCKTLNNDSKNEMVPVDDKKEKILSKLRSEYKPGIILKNRGSKNSALALKVALMKLKSQAIGQESIPIEERAYFYLSFIKSEQNYNQDFKAFQEKPIFLCKEWSIGKCVDWIAQHFSLVNRNNEPNKPKLVLLNEDCLLADKKCNTLKKCCENQGDYLCYPHYIKDLLANESISITGSLIITYMLI